MATTMETRTLRDHFADIHNSIPASGVTTFADELLQAGLICVASHSAAIEIAGLSSSNKISSLVSEVMTKVAGSQDKLATFVSILESRNKGLAETLRRKHASYYETDHQSTGRRQHGAGYEGNKSQLTPADLYSHFTDTSSQSGELLLHVHVLHPRCPNSQS